MEIKSLIPRPPQRSEFVAFKMTPDEFQTVMEFCEKNKLTQSELYRYATLQFIAKNQQQ